jgi:hypothetical protein
MRKRKRFTKHIRFAVLVAVAVVADVVAILVTVTSHI